MVNSFVKPYYYTASELCQSNAKTATEEPRNYETPELRLLRQPELSPQACIHFDPVFHSTTTTCHFPFTSGSSQGKRPSPLPLSHPSSGLEPHVHVLVGGIKDFQLVFSKQVFIASLFLDHILRSVCENTIICLPCCLMGFGKCHWSSTALCLVFCHRIFLKKCITFYSKAVAGKFSDKRFCISFTTLLRYYKEEELYATVYVKVTLHRLWAFHWLHQRH